MLGIHVHKGDYKTTYEAVIDKVNKHKINTVQIFTHGPQNSKQNDIDINKLSRLDNILVYVHSTYMSSPWNGNKFSMLHIQDQLKVCSQIRAEALVIHLRKDKISNIIDKLKVIIRYGQKIILEAPAMKTDKLTFESVDRLNKLCLEIKKFATPEHVGICIDTSHETAGNIDLSSYEAANTFLKALKYPEYISLFHLNGTIYPLGSGKDMHEVAFSKTDIIWNKYLSCNKNNKYNIYNSGVAAIVKFSKKYSVPIILEVNREASLGDTDKALKRLKIIFKSIK